MARFVVAITILPACLGLAWLVLRRPFREICEEIHFERARELFRLQRERLEARFLSRLDQHDPEARLHWDDAHWHDSVHWARDRKTRRLVALVGVHFDPPPFTDDPPTFATAIFEYRRGEWTTDGHGFDEIRPDEALFLHVRLEPIHEITRRPSQFGGMMG